MSQPDEFLLKQMAEKEAEANQAQLNRDCFGASEPSLDEQIKNAEHRTQYDRDELNRLRELKFLLEKNPETGRILQLLRLMP